MVIHPDAVESACYKCPNGKRFGDKARRELERESRQLRGYVECLYCGEWEADYEAHHIRPSSEGGVTSPENGIILCPRCHKSAHSGEMPTLERLAAWATKYGYEEALMEISRRIEKITLFGEDK